MRFPVTGFAVSGKAGAGKSTLGHHLQHVLAANGWSSCVTAFGTALKREVEALYGLTKADPGGRAKLIEHGEARRHEDPHYWIRECAKIVDYSRQQGYVCVIDDLRFPAEYDWVRSRGFVTVRLEVPVDVRTRRLERDGHETGIAQSFEVGESGLDGYLPGFDYVYFDDGTANLQAVARELILCELNYVEEGLSRPRPEQAA